MLLNEPTEDEEELEEVLTLEDHFNGEQMGLLLRNYIRTQNYIRALNHHFHQEI